MLSALVWPIKDSFLDYLDALEDVAIETIGAQRIVEGFRFPLDTSRTGLAFTGSILLTAHAGAMHVEFASPRIEHDERSAVLMASTPSGDIALARILDYPDDDATLRAYGGVLSDIALTMEGSAMLGSVYGPWARMSPILLLAD